MKYYLDTEFIEGFHKPLFSKKRHFIDLISIGIVAEDGRELYLISNEYNYNDADDWVKENVILPLYINTVHGDARNVYDVYNFHKRYGVSNKEIAESVFQFCTNDTLTIEKAKYYNVVHDGIEFYAYYADYDWVLFCSLFGRMIDLPKGFPMYCKDLKQLFDEKQQKWANISENRRLDFCKRQKFYSVEIDLKNLSSYPQQNNEHNALDDAKWNMELHKFLNKLR
jgi:hypothetical protein